MHSELLFCLALPNQVYLLFYDSSQFSIVHISTRYLIYEFAKERYSNRRQQESRFLVRLR
jgi:hypothetical protein